MLSNNNAVTAFKLPPEIERGVQILHKYFPIWAPPIRPALEVLMQPLLADLDNLPAWKLSVLTEDGYPFEFTFTTLNDGIRYTLEIAPPRESPENRLEQARQLLQQLGIQSFDEERFKLLKQLQADGELEYGAWIGVRHNQQGVDYKIYVEVPPQGTDLAARYLDRLLRAPVFVKDRSISLRMIGFYPATGELEFYFRVFELRPWEIIALMGPVGLQAHRDAVFHTFEHAYGRAMHQRLPGPIFGFSYALAPAVPRKPVVFSLYTFSDTIFGNGAASRRKLLRFFAENELDMGCYTEMSEPLARQTGKQNYHGLFGVAVAQNAPPVVHIGLRPPKAGEPHG